MKITACMDAYGTGVSSRQTDLPVFRAVREQTRADFLIVITCGNFSQAGDLEMEDKYRRAERLRGQGADLVLELPVYCTLTTLDTFAFASVSMLEKLNCVDELVLFSENADREILSEIADFLFLESAGYQEKVKKMMESGAGFTDAQAAVTEQYIPGAGQVLLCETNRKAVEYLKAMKRLYSTMKAGIFDLAAHGETVVRGTETGYEREKSCVSRRLASMFSGMLEGLTEEQRKTLLNETAGGYGPKTDSILTEYKENGISDFDRFAENLASGKRTVRDLKRYLLRVMLGIRQVDISICGLYSYAVYARAIGGYENSACFSRVKSASWIPVFSEESPDAEEKGEPGGEAEDSAGMLRAIERRAADLYRSVCSSPAAAEGEI